MMESAELQKQLQVPANDNILGLLQPSEDFNEGVRVRHTSCKREIKENEDQEKGLFRELGTLAGL